MKNCSKTKQNFTRAPSGERHFYWDSKNSTQSPDYTLGMAGNHGIINDKIRSKILISPTNAQTAKLSNMSSMDSHLLNYTQIPIYFNTKKSKSRKRNSNLKSSCSDKKSKNCSSSEKKQSNKKSKCCVYFSSVLSESTPRENELSPFHGKLLFNSSTMYFYWYINIIFSEQWNKPLQLNCSEEKPSSLDRIRIKSLHTRSVESSIWRKYLQVQTT